MQNSAALNTITLYVHKINKQDMENNICITGVKLNTQRVFFLFTQIHVQRHLRH